MQKICLIVTANQYQSKQQFTVDLEEGFRQLGLETRLVDCSRGRILDLAEIREFQPDWTISFNNLRPMEDGSFFWDVLEIPHLSIVLDPPIYSWGLFETPYSHACVVDGHDLDLLQSKGFSRSFFLPHGASHALQGASDDYCIYDAVFFGSCYDHRALKRAWEREFSKDVAQAIEEAADEVLSDSDISFMQATERALSKRQIDPQDVEFFAIAWYVDYYSRAVDRFLLLEALRGVRVHVFGDPHPLVPDSLGWQSYLKDLPHVQLHPAVSFKQSLLILKKSKLCLSSSPMFRRGSHERVLNGLLAGARVLTSDSTWFREELGEAVCIYSPGKWKEASEHARAALEKGENYFGQDLILRGHLWSQRARDIVEALESGAFSHSSCRE